MAPIRLGMQAIGQTFGSQQLAKAEYDIATAAMATSSIDLGSNT